MINEKIYKLINYFVKDIIVVEYRESIWFVLQKEQKWILELNKHNKLVYNFDYFKMIFNYTSISDGHTLNNIILSWAKKYLLGCDVESIYMDSGHLPFQKDFIKRKEPEKVIQKEGESYEDYLSRILSAQLSNEIDYELSNSLFNTRNHIFSTYIKGVCTGDNDRIAWELGEQNKVTVRPIEEFILRDGVRI